MTGSCLMLQGTASGVGRSEVGPGAQPFVIVERGGRATSDREGALSRDGRVMGTYIHGLFANGAVRRPILGSLARHRGSAPDPRWGIDEKPAARYDRLADAVARSVDMPAITKLARL